MFLIFYLGVLFDFGFDVFAESQDSLIFNLGLLFDSKCDVFVGFDVFDIQSEFVL